MNQNEYIREQSEMVDSLLEKGYSPEEILNLSDEEVLDLRDLNRDVIQRVIDFRDALKENAQRDLIYREAERDALNEMLSVPIYKAINGIRKTGRGIKKIPGKTLRGIDLTLKYIFTTALLPLIPATMPFTTKRGFSRLFENEGEGENEGDGILVTFFWGVSNAWEGLVVFPAVEKIANFGLTYEESVVAYAVVALGLGALDGLYALGKKVKQKHAFRSDQLFQEKLSGLEQLTS